MPTIHVRGVPAVLHQRLRTRAETHGCSLSSEVIRLLEWALEEVDRSAKASLAAIRERRSFKPAAVGAPDSTSLLRDDRKR